MRMTLAVAAAFACRRFPGPRLAAAMAMPVVRRRNCLRVGWVLIARSALSSRLP